MVSQGGILAYKFFASAGLQFQLMEPLKLGENVLWCSLKGLFFASKCQRTKSDPRNQNKYYSTFIKTHEADTFTTGFYG